MYTRQYFTELIVKERHRRSVPYSFGIPSVDMKRR